MDTKAGFFALAVSAALVMALGAMLSADAMAQALDEAPVENDVAAVQDEVAQHPVPMQKPAAAERPPKSNLNQSAVRSAPVTSTPRPTRTSTRAVVLPKILGSYR